MSSMFDTPYWHHDSMRCQWNKVMCILAQRSIKICFSRQEKNPSASITSKLSQKHSRSFVWKAFRHFCPWSLPVCTWHLTERLSMAAKTMHSPRSCTAAYKNQISLATSFSLFLSFFHRSKVPPAVGAGKQFPQIPDSKSVTSSTFHRRPCAGADRAAAKVNFVMVNLTARKPLDGWYPRSMRVASKKTTRSHCWLEHVRYVIRNFDQSDKKTPVDHARFACPKGPWWALALREIL